MSIDNALRELVREEVERLLPTLLPGREEYLTTKEVAELTGLSVQFFEIGRSRDAADQPPYSRVGRRIIYRRSEVEKWLEERRRGA
ncbi:MAG: helix-turn-helix domain-containing protein [Pseudomonadota bacterium]